MRAWRVPVETVLGGPLATLPLAPIARLRRDALPGAIRGMDERLRREATRDQAAQLWVATFILMGLRYPEAVVERLLGGIEMLRESTTYQRILREGWDAGHEAGAVEAAREIVQRLGRRRFGPPPEWAVSALDAVDDLERREVLSERVLDATGWEDLLDEVAGSADGSEARG